MQGAHTANLYAVHHINLGEKWREFMKRILELEGKPYYRCLTCPYFPENRCNIPFSQMSLMDWSICMRYGKEANHLTNAYVSEKSDVSIKTVEKIFALTCDQDIRRETARRMEIAIFGEPGDFVCCRESENNVPEASEQLKAAMLDLERALHDNEDIKAAMENVQTTHAAQLQAIQDECNAKIADLRLQNERLQRDNDNLWAENIRKSKMIDQFVFHLNAKLFSQEPQN